MFTYIQAERRKGVLYRAHGAAWSVLMHVLAIVWRSTHEHLPCNPQTTGDRRRVSGMLLRVCGLFSCLLGSI